MASNGSQHPAHSSVLCSQVSRQSFFQPASRMSYMAHVAVYKFISKLAKFFQSAVFEAMLQRSNLCESNDKIVKTNIKSKTLQNLLDAVYCQDVETFNFHNACDLQGVLKLLNFCIQFLIIIKVQEFLLKPQISVTSCTLLWI